MYRDLNFHLILGQLCGLYLYLLDQRTQGLDRFLDDLTVRFVGLGFLNVRRGRLVLGLFSSDIDLIIFAISLFRALIRLLLLLLNTILYLLNAILQLLSFHVTLQSLFLRLQFRISGPLLNLRRLILFRVLALLLNFLRFLYRDHSRDHLRHGGARNATNGGACDE